MRPRGPGNEDGSTREINLVFPSTHVFFCLLYKGQSLKSDNFYRKAIIEKR